MDINDDRLSMIESESVDTAGGVMVINILRLTFRHKGFLLDG